MIELRVAELTDLEWLVELHARADFNRWIPRPPDTDRAALREEMEAKLALNDEGRGCLVVAMVDGAPAGYGALVLSPRRGHVEYGVDPAHQGQGVGGAVLDGLKALGRHYGMPELFAVVHRQNAPSVGLLLSRGFERSGAWERSPELYDTFTHRLGERGGGP